MFMRNTKKGQTAIEYVAMFSVVLLAWLFIQFGLRRSVQGAGKSSSQQISKREYSLSGTTTYDESTMESGNNQNITFEENTDADFVNFMPTGYTSQEIFDTARMYTLETRDGGKMTSESKMEMDAAQLEKFKVDELDDTPETDFEEPMW